MGVDMLVELSELVVGEEVVFVVMYDVVVELVELIELVMLVVMMVLLVLFVIVDCWIDCIVLICFIGLLLGDKILLVV